MITVGTATVYSAGGRRYLTLDAACRAKARAFIKRWLIDQGEEWGSMDQDWYYPRVSRLAGLYKAQHKRLARIE